MVFEWVHPAFTPVLEQIASRCVAQPDVMTPLLKTVRELATHRGRRIQFPSTSANGMVLFRVCCKVGGLFSRAYTGPVR